MPVTDLSPRRKRFIAELATDVFHGYGGGRVKVEPLEIIDNVEIGYSFDDFGDCFDGLIEHRRGEFHIYCNSKTNEYEGSPRTRFTQAHELGHYFLDEHRNLLAAGKDPHASTTDGPGKLLVEREANYFASNLLMPREELLLFLKRTTSGLQAILDAGSHFGVSAQSTAIRYVQDCGARCAIVMFREGKPSWSETSPALTESGFHHPKKFTDAHPQGGATDEAWAADRTRLSQIFGSTSTASFWFPGVIDSSASNEIITEQAVRLGSRGVLAFVSFGPALAAAERWN